MAKTTSHVPTGGQISQAIAATLKQYDGPVNAKVVQEKLVKAHPNWKLPERRVNKFLKRHLNSDTTTTTAINNEGDDDTAKSSEPKSPKKRSSLVKPFIRLFGRKSSKKKLAPEQAPLVPDMMEPEPEPEPEPIIEEPEPIVEEKSFDAVYEDDNNPAEKEKCECSACSIM
eukprot:CAMPEP_0117049954 /NCGR_PEP_ID=MMETSP0472-20121206/34489_1 /TAXON_ID=693140 ORGANISM="Tiarina fusus, Strain LIS" /NCGR_SAMPLE_ID=MMETSP0472 /ASSEMBLY_ACC=CAM_ASM_000603 /LENGTH=170 /DNA_ID=CAMNT_0004763549 /DNA_START=24 /DNA_END=536 /DNA_ORIENTATION=+